MDCEDNNSSLRVASFSVYLTTDNTIAHNLAGAIQDSSPAIISPEENPCPISLGRTKSKEGELGIFSADKYFNMKMDYESSRLTDDSSRKYGHMKDGRNDLHRVKTKFRPGISSASSEASYNSQTSLLPSLLRNLSQTKLKRPSGKRFFVGFGCYGPCLSKRSVYISESVDQHGLAKGAKPSLPESKRGDQFAFPILDSGKENLIVKKQLEEEKFIDPRDSIEVFGSRAMKKGDIAMNLERKLSMLTWDAIPKAQNIPTSFGGGTIGDDIASDASSDLFEIENISGTGYSVLTRQASDNMSSCMSPTTQYAPSEASIEWSVVTASAADFSVVSDYDEKSVRISGEMILNSATSKTAKSKNTVSNEAQKNRPTELLGCKSHKAVKVGETAYITSEKAKIGRSQTETRVKAIESLRAQHSFASRGFSP